MAYILDARTHAEQMPRLAWIEATGNGSEIRLTVATALGVIACGVGKAEELEVLAVEGGECVFSGDLWVERTEQPQIWRVSVVNAPETGSFWLSAYDLACGLQQIQLDHMRSTDGVSALGKEGASRPEIERLGSLQMARGSSFDA